MEGNIGILGFVICFVILLLPSIWVLLVGYYSVLLSSKEDGLTCLVIAAILTWLWWRLIDSSPFVVVVN